MNCVSILNNLFRRAINPVLTIPSAVQIQQTRNTFVLKRRHPVPPIKINRKRPKYLEQKYFIYDLVEYQSLEAVKKPIDLILTTFIEEVGDVGDKISVLPYKAYEQYLIPGLAVYATPENVEKFEEINQTKAKVEFSSPYVPRAIKYLHHHLLHVIMSNDNEWTLENYHIKAALRFNKIHVNDDCITLPERLITGPNPEMENKEFYVTLSINKREQVNVRCRIHLWSTDPRNTLLDPDTFNDLSEPLFPEFKQVLDELPVPNTITAQIKKKSLASKRK